jgi:hypothetical protein
MDLSFNTTSVDVSVALKALKHYRAREFNLAIEALLSVLDVEPRNWDARLMLGCCYYKTNQFGSAHRAFKMIYDRCLDADLKQKAADGMRASEAKLGKTNDIPLEFGAVVERMVPQKIISWLD